MTDATDWAGPVGRSWATEWQRTDRSFAGLSPHLNAAIRAAARPDDRILDIGCGAGATTLATAKALPDARITGIDLSPELIAVAQSRAGDSANADFVVADITRAAAGYRPDFYISRHGVMFFADPIAAFTVLAKAAVPGARLVFSCFVERRANRWAAESITAAGGDGNAPTGAAPGPFAFADPAHVAAILTAAGWDVETPTRIDFAYRAGEGPDAVADAVDFFTRIGPAAPLLRAAATDDRARNIAALTALCDHHISSDAVEFPASAWIWTAHRPSKGSMS